MRDKQDIQTQIDKLKLELDFYQSGKDNYSYPPFNNYYHNKIDLTLSYIKLLEWVLNE